MNVTKEELGNCMVKLIVEVDEMTMVKQIEECCKAHEEETDPGVIFDEAVNKVLPEAYKEAVAQAGIVPTSTPVIEMISLEVNAPLVFSATVAVEPTVVLGEYKGLVVPVVKAEVTDSDVEEELIRIAQELAAIVEVDRPVADGDTVTINYRGFQDGNQFQGGTADGFDLMIGSHSFIDTFEDQLIGAVKGDTVQVHVTFPEAYHAPDLAGKPALFEVDIVEVKETRVPPLDEKFAKGAGCASVEEYKQQVRAQVLERKTIDANADRAAFIVEKAVANAQVVVAPAMLESAAESVMNSFMKQIAEQGVTFEQYLELVEMTEEELKAGILERTEFDIRTRAVLKEIAKAEALELTEEDIEKELTLIGQSYGLTPDMVRSMIDVEGLKPELLASKATWFIVNEAREA